MAVRDTRLTGNNPLAYVGVNAGSPPNLKEYDRAPTTGDNKNFIIGDLWMDNTTSPVSLWVLVDLEKAIATWVKLTAGDASESFVTDAGTAIPVAAVINVLGGTNTTTAGAGNTVTVNSTLPADVADEFATDAGSAIPAANILTIAGGTNISTAGAGSTVTANLDPSISLAGSLTVGTTVDFSAFGLGALLSDATGSISSANGTDGQVLVAGTGLIPAWAGITSSDGTVTVTGGANTLDLTAAGGGLVAAGDNINLTVGTTVNLNETIHWPYTNAGGTTGVIYLGGAGGVGGSRFFHGYNPGSPGRSIFIGEDAGNFTNTTSDSNTAVGFQSQTSLTSGDSNTSLGDEALKSVTTGDANTALGDDAMADLVTGNWNIAIGGDLVPGTGLGVGSTYVGAESNNILLNNAGIAAENNTIRLGTHGAGDRQQNRCFIAGIRGITTGTADAIAVLIDSSYQLGTASSTIRSKQNVNDMTTEGDDVLNLRPVTFEYKEHPGIKQYGLIAEEVKEVLPRLVVNDDDGEPLTVQYHVLPSLLLDAIKKLAKRVDELEAKLEG